MKRIFTTTMMILSFAGLITAQQRPQGQRPTQATGATPTSTPVKEESTPKIYEYC
jgi:hypothetical protein